MPRFTRFTAFTKKGRKEARGKWLDLLLLVFLGVLALLVLTFMAALNMPIQAKRHDEQKA